MPKIISAKDLQINLDNANEEGLFRWLMASFLMGKRIQTEIAANAYKVIVDQYQIDTPRKLASCSRRELVAMLGEARYVHYDESTATRLQALASKINEEYSGRVGNIFEVSVDPPESKAGHISILRFALRLVNHSCFSIRTHLIELFVKCLS